ncbi:MAG: DUF4349 domain-containing protein [Candidatus Aenigmarchaeota archaeon]|nr:DUF4349 domain-containing protein [Candidatus Aenigmarchaeota archaeon]
MGKKIKKYISFAKKNKITIIGILLILLIAWLVVPSLMSFSGQMRAPALSKEGGWSNDYAPAAAMMDSDEMIESEYQIKRGSASIETEDAVSDYEKIKARTEEIEGRAEDMNKREDDNSLRVTATLRIPSESFDSFVGWLTDNFDVESANVGFYMESVEKQEEEIEILSRGLGIYDTMLVKAEKMNVSSESIDVVMRLTDKKMELMRRLKQYGYSIKNVKEKAKLSTLSVTLTEKKKIKLVPEDMRRNILIKIKEAFGNIVDMLTELITMPILILVRLFVWVIYVVIVIVPLFVVFKLLLKFFKKLNKKF